MKGNVPPDFMELHFQMITIRENCNVSREFRCFFFSTLKGSFKTVIAKHYVKCNIILSHNANVKYHIKM